MPHWLDRRELLRRMAAAGAFVATHGTVGYALLLEGAAGATEASYSLVVVDFARCNGCRTCETACSAANHPIEVDGVLLPGLGNPALSSIRVHRFNPDVDVPVTCAMCEDAPCVASCPVPEDEVTGRRALYRDPRTGAIRCDVDRCVACGSCSTTCSAQRTGVIRRDARSGQPVGMCTLCDGDPQCVRLCPYEALSFRRGTVDWSLRGQSPEKVAEVLMRSWYQVGA